MTVDVIKVSNGYIIKRDGNFIGEETLLVVGQDDLPVRIGKAILLLLENQDD